ncbi:MAG: hypothetical protein HC887_11905 [Desulfobacteraceae bacterium]|nr:hypothetical protein [Desulfobacteraceae bacterium]
MDVICEKCQNVIKIPDEKVPKGRAFAIGCPKCKHKNSVNPDAEAKSEPAKPNPSPPPKAEAQTSVNGQEDTDENGAPRTRRFGISGRRREDCAAV